MVASSIVMYEQPDSKQRAGRTCEKRDKQRKRLPCTFAVLGSLTWEMPGTKLAP